jgi:NodT family efflux transporter outer membrane factor (OMF) lipoprotein
MQSIISFVLLFLIFTSCANVGKRASLVKPLKSVDIEEVRNSAIKDKALFTSGDWPEKNWWDDFEDKRLSSSIEKALKDSPSLQSVEARVLAARAHAEVVRSKLFPKIDALFNLIWVYFSKDIQKQFPSVDPNFHFYTAGFDFTYEFDFWGKNKKTFLAAIGDVETEKALYEQAKIILTTSVAISYYNLQATVAKLQVINALLENRKKQLELTHLKDENKIADQIEVASVKGEVLFLEESKRALEEEKNLHQSSFLTLIGQNPSVDIDFDYSWKVLYTRFEIPKEIGLKLLARRADLAAQMARVKKSADLVGVAISQFYPSVNLAGLIGFQTLDFDHLCTGRSFIPSLLPLVQLPIFHGGELRGNLKEKMALHESVVFAYNDAILNAANEVVRSINRLRASHERLDFQMQKTSLAREMSELTNIKYKQGIDSLLKALQVEEQYLWVELHQIELQRIKYESIILLIKALGGGYTDE